MLADKEKLLQQVYANLAASASSAAAVQPCGGGGGGARGPGPLPAPQSTATTATTAGAPPGEDLSGASTDAVCAWMRERGLGHHEGLFREHGLQGSDLVDLVAPDGHGFSTEQVRQDTPWCTLSFVTVMPVILAFPRLCCPLTRCAHSCLLTTAPVGTQKISWLGINSQAELVALAAALLAEPSLQPM
jgi:hypothetical protein|eukprot:COSAG01_NODE_9120_length_2545_cov_2.658217_3_plen_188_part_00